MKKYLYKIFIALFSLFLSIFILFLYKPNIFINNIDYLIKNKFIDNLPGNLTFTNSYGNFIKGFTLENVSYETNETHFSAKRIYIDPDLSRILFNNIVLSEVTIHNGNLIIPDDVNNLNEIKHSNFSPSLNIKITSLNINNSIIISNNKLINLNGNFNARINNGLKIQFNNVRLDSPQFDSHVSIPTGSIYYNVDIITTSDMIIKSNWINGSLDFTINFNDYSKTLSNIYLDKLDYENSNVSINAKNITLLKLREEDDIMLNLEKIDNGNYTLDSIRGIISLNSKTMEANMTMKVFDNLITTSTNFDLMSFKFNSIIDFNNFTHNHNSIQSGKISIITSNNYDSAYIDLAFEKSNFSKFNIDSIRSTFYLNQDLVLHGDVAIINNDHHANINISSLKDIENLKINGKLILDNYDIKNNGLYTISKLNSDLTGEIQFAWELTNNIGYFSSNSYFTNGHINGYEFNSIDDSTVINHTEHNFISKSNGLIKNLIHHPYEWERIPYNLSFDNHGLSEILLSCYDNYDNSLNLNIKKIDDTKYIVNHAFGVLHQSSIKILPFEIIHNDNSIFFENIYAYIADGFINISGKYNDQYNYTIHGAIDSIDIKNINTILGKNYPLNGKIVDSNFHIENGDSNFPIIFTNFHIIDGSLTNTPFDLLSVSTSYRENRLLISEFNMLTETGKIDLTGWINKNLISNPTIENMADEMDLHFNLDKFEIKHFNSYLPWQFESSGLITGEGKISGPLNDMQIFTNINIQKPIFDKIIGDELAGIITYKNQKLIFNNLLLKTKSGQYMAGGYIPLSLIKKSNINIKTLPIDLIVTGKSNELEFVSQYINSIDSIYGMNSNDSSFTLILEITGNMENPVRNGKLIINNAKVNLNALNNSIENIDATLQIVNNRLIIDNLMANLHHYKTKNYLKKSPIYNIASIFKKKKVNIENNLNISGSMDLQSFFNPDYSIHLKGDDIYLESAYENFMGHGSTNLYVTGKDTVIIKGIFKPDPNDFLITSYGKKEFNYNENNSYIPFVININVPLNDGIEIKTNNANLLIDGDVTLSKSIGYDFGYSGRVNIIDGRYYDNQGNMYENISGELFLSPDEDYSFIDLHANTNISPSTIDLTIVGNPSNPQIHFSDSEGKYSQTQLLSLMAFGSTEIDIENNITNVENMITNYFENKIERNIAEMATLDEFQLSGTGLLLGSKDGQDDLDVKLIIGKRISKKVYLNTHIDFYDFSDNQYEAEYRLSPNTSLVGGVNTYEGNNSFHVKYRIKYYY